jgi:nucleoside-diphosphate-sugar epimerase
MKRILVLGGSGFLGSYVASFLRTNHEVDTTSTKNREGFIKLDILHDDLDFLKSYDCVVNCVVSYQKEALPIFDANVGGTVRILEAIGSRALHYINVSTVFSSSGNETTNHYAFTKYLGDHVVRYYAGRSTAKFTTLRFGQLYDKVGKARATQHGLFYFIDRVKKNEPLTLNGDHKRKRTYMPVELACKCVGHAMTHKITGDHDVTMPDSYSALELTNVLAGFSGYDVGMISYNEKVATVSYQVPPCSEAFSELLKRESNLPYFKELFMHA